MNQQPAVLTDNYLLFIQQRLQTTCRQIEQQVHEATQFVQNRASGSLAPNQKGQGQPLSVVKGSSESENSTLLFTQETQQTFLRTALNRDLFVKLKKVSQRWLANVDEDKRRQATKISQEVAKAVCSLRVNFITNEDLNIYRTRIQQSFGQPYHIPTAELEKAFSRKIRVYLQNTKAKHDKWVNKFHGKLDVRAKKFYIENDGMEDEDAEMSMDSSGIIRDEADSTDEEGEDTPKLGKPQSQNAITALPTHYLSEPTERKYTTLADLLANRFTLSKEEFRREVFNYCLSELKTNLVYSSEILADPFVFYIAFCVIRKIFEFSLDDMVMVLQQTTLRLMGACFRLCDPRTRNPVHMSVIARKPRESVESALSDLMESDPDSEDTMFHHIIRGGSFYPTYNELGLCIIAGFVDYGINMNALSLPDWLPIIEAQKNGTSLATECLRSLGVPPIPVDIGMCEHSEDVASIVLLLIYCALRKQFSMPYPDETQLVGHSGLIFFLFDYLCDLVLFDMLDKTFDQLRNSVPATLSDYVERWQAR